MLASLTILHSPDFGIGMPRQPKSSFTDSSTISWSETDTLTPSIYVLPFLIISDMNTVYYVYYAASLHLSLTYGVPIQYKYWYFIIFYLYRNCV